MRRHSGEALATLFRPGDDGWGDEVLLATGLALITVALWPVCGRLALLVPGLVLVWIFLPTRTAFVAGPPAPEPGRKR